MTAPIDGVEGDEAARRGRAHGLRVKKRAPAPSGGKWDSVLDELQPRSLCDALQRGDGMTGSIRGPATSTMTASRRRWCSTAPCCRRGAVQPDGRGRGPVASDEAAGARPFDPVARPPPSMIWTILTGDESTVMVVTTWSYVAASVSRHAGLLRSAVRRAAGSAIRPTATRHLSVLLLRTAPSWA